MRYLLKLAYNGTNYHGWQRQKNAVSVQEKIEYCLGKLLNQKVDITGCGRTDTGVHALEYYAHFDINENDNLPFNITSKEFIGKINIFLPDDIVIYEVKQVHNEFHARFDAISRTYIYRIHTLKDPFVKNHSLYIHYPLDIEILNEYASELLKFKDFACFCKSNSNAENFLCDIIEAGWERMGDHILFTITANRFLRNMVRAIVGTILSLYKKSYDVAFLRHIILSQERQKAGESVPGYALYLQNIAYPKAQLKIIHSQNK